MIEQTRNQLAQLKLHGVLATLDDRLREATSTGWGHVELLSALVQDEKLHRDSLKERARVRTARFRINASIDRFDFTAPRSITRAQVSDLARLSFVTEPRNLLIFGPTGVGKTFLASSLGFAACRAHFTTLFFGLHELIERLVLARVDGTWLKFRDRLSKCDLLIIDDVGLKKLEPTVVQDLYDVLEERQTLKSTIITSQLPLKNWKEIIDDPVILEAILDRLIHGSIQIQLDGDSYRKKRVANSAVDKP